MEQATGPQSPAFVFGGRAPPARRRRTPPAAARGPRGLEWTRRL